MQCTHYRNAGTAPAASEAGQQCAAARTVPIITGPESQQQTQQPVPLGLRWQGGWHSHRPPRSEVSMRLQFQTFATQVHLATVLLF